MFIIDLYFLVGYLLVERFPRLYLYFLHIYPIQTKKFNKLYTFLPSSTSRILYMISLSKSVHSTIFEEFIFELDQSLRIDCTTIFLSVTSHHFFCFFFLRCYIFEVCQMISILYDICYDHTWSWRYIDHSPTTYVFSMYLFSGSIIDHIYRHDTRANSWEEWLMSRKYRDFAHFCHESDTEESCCWEDISRCGSDLEIHELFRNRFAL